MDPLDRKEQDIQANREAGLISAAEAEQQLADLARYREEGPSEAAVQQAAALEDLATTTERGSPEPSEPDPTSVDSHVEGEGGEGGPDPVEEEEEDAGGTGDTSPEDPPAGPGEGEEESPEAGPEEGETEGPPDPPGPGA